MVDQISTYSQMTNALANIISTQNSLYKLQQQTTSAVQSSSYIDLYTANGSIDSFVNLKSGLSQVVNFQKNNEEIINRLSGMDVSMGGIIDVASMLRDSITKRINASGKSTDLASVVKNNYLPLIESNLNTNLEGRYLFSGTATNIVPVSNLSTNDNRINNTATANYFSGNGTVLTAQITEETQLSYGVTADNQVFQSLIALANSTADADKNNDLAALAQSEDVINQIIQDLTTLRAEVGNNMKAIESANNGFAIQQVTLSSMLNDVNATDFPSTITQITNYTTQLQASYKVLNLMYQTSLVEYINY